MKAFFACCFCLRVFLSFGQIADSVLSRQVDSLIAVSRQLTAGQQFAEAMQAGEAAQKTALEVFGTESAEYARCLFNRGRIFQFLGNYDAAGPLYVEAKAIRERVLGKENAEYVWSLNNLANLYRELGRYEDAEPLYRDACAIQEKIFGKETPMFALLLNNLGLLYHYMGRYEAAEPLHREAMAIREKVLGKEHRDYAVSLNNLADLYSDMGRYEAAESLYREARDIREKAGKETLEYAQSLNNLAILYHLMGRYESAEPLYREANAIWEKILGNEHPNYATTLNNLASLYYAMGRDQDAERLYLEANVIWEKKFGREHPNYAAGLNNLAELYTSMGRYAAADTLYREANAITNALLSRSARFLSEGELTAYVQIFTKDLDHYYSFAQITQGQFPGFSASCYDNALFHKGFLLNAACQIGHLAASDTAAARLNELVKSYRRSLAREYAKPFDERAGVDDLEARANAAEKELVRTVAGFGEAVRQVRWQEVQAALAPGEAAIEFVRYRYYNPRRTDSIVYAALVLRPGVAQPRMVPLFEERQLTRLLPTRNDFDRIDEFYQFNKTGRAVCQLIWQPLEPLLAGATTVYCSASGLLHRINLGAIPVAPALTFADRRRLVLLGSTRQLVLKNPAAEPNVASAVLFGDVRYDLDSTAAPLASAGGFAESPLAFPQDTTLRNGSAGPWKNLPATASEIRNIAALLQKNGFQTQLLSASAATEEAFKELGRAEASPRILHLATHGYFFFDPETVPDERPAGEKSPVFQSSSHPMIRSGLILAGANAAWTTGHPPAQREDGILTAYEISQQNLSNTELVVLSACETGLGEIAGNEGVYGLQRAFKIAGARYLVMSLWQVSDQKTGELMIEFYRRRLDRHLPVPEAFRQAQQAMRTRYPGSPYVWAGFVLLE